MMTQTKQSGFSLLEILIAFSILAISLGILLKIFSAGTKTAAVAEEYNVAVQLAESLMVRAGVETKLQVGEVSGRDNDKYAWRIVVSPYPFNPDDLNIDADTLKTELYKVDVTVRWDEEAGENARSLAISTLKVRNKPAL